MEEMYESNDVRHKKIILLWHRIVTLILLIGFHFGHHVGKESDEWLKFNILNRIQVKPYQYNKQYLGMAIIFFSHYRNISKDKVMAYSFFYSRSTLDDNKKQEK